MKRAVSDPDKRSNEVPKVITAQQVHRIYCFCGGYGYADVAAAEAYNKARS